jgi:hypothetical protein
VRNPNAPALSPDDKDVVPDHMDIPGTGKPPSSPYHATELADSTANASTSPDVTLMFRPDRSIDSMAQAAGHAARRPIGCVSHLKGRQDVHSYRFKPTEVSVEVDLTEKAGQLGNEGRVENRCG